MTGTSMVSHEWSVPDHVPAEVVVPFDFMRGEYVHAFPPEAVESFREHRVLFSPLYGGFWVLTRYDDIRTVFQDDLTFEQSPSGTIPAVRLTRPLIPSTLNGSEHQSWRKLLLPLFTSRRASQLDGELRDYVRERAHALRGAERCEVMADFAKELPVVRFCRQWGFDRSQGDELLHLGNELIYGSERVIAEQGVEAGQAYRAKVMDQVDELLSVVLTARRRAPGDDVLSELIQMSHGGALLTDDDILNVMSLFFFAGSDSSSAAIAYAFLRLATHPDERRAFVANVDQRAGFVEELLRIGAVHYISRRVARDVEFGGVSMKAGDMVALPTLAANRDPNAFEGASRVDPDRTSAHFTFGIGKHRCIGLHYARMEMRLTLEEFHDVIPDYSLDPDAPITFMTGVRSRPHTVPLILHPAP